MDKDEGAMTDDYIGEFETSIASGAKEAEITGPMFRRNRGTFWLKVSFHPPCFPFGALCARVKILTSHSCTDRLNT